MMRRSSRGGSFRLGGRHVDTESTNMAFNSHATMKVGTSEGN